MGLIGAFSLWILISPLNSGVLGFMFTSFHFVFLSINSWQLFIVS
jgi:hypothetical protein